MFPAIKIYGFFSVLLATGYIVAEAIAFSDGPGDFEVAPPLARVLLSVSLAGAILCGVTLIGQQGLHASVEQHIRPVVREELETVSRDVSESLARALDERFRRAVEHGTATTVAALKEVVTGEMMRDELNHAINKAYRIGMVAEVERQKRAAARPHGVSNGKITPLGQPRGL